MKRTLVLATGLAGALVLGAILVRGCSRDGPRPLQEDSAARGAAEPAGPALASPAVTGRREPSASAGPAGKRAGGHTGSGPRVLVVDGRSGAPLAGAVVRWLDLTSPELLAAIARGAKGQDLIETAGARAETDAAGIARVSPHPMLVRARHGRLWNEVKSPWITDEPLRLELFPDLVVEVVDGAGKPVGGVPLELRLLERGSFDTTSGETGADGRATFSHEHIRRRASEGMEVRFGLPLGADDVVLGLAADELPEEPLRMVLPPTGRVVVELRDLDGTPLAAPASVVLFAAQERLHDLARDRATSSGTIVFEHVGLGLELQCRARLEPTDESPLPVELGTRVPGPRQPGEEVRIVLGLGREEPVLCGRLVGAGARPLANARGFVTARAALEDERQLPSELATLAGLDFRTNREGRFRIRLLPGALPAAARTLVFSLGTPDLLADLERSARSGPPGMGRVDLAGPLGLGVVDVGDVVLGEAPLLAAGRVVDDLGAPVAGVFVQLSRSGGVLADGSKVWLPIAGTDAATARDGAFEIRGWVPERSVAIAVGASRPEPIEVGASGLVLTLERPGIVAGELLLDPDLPAECITVSLYYLPGENLQVIDEWVRFPRAGEPRASFRWPKIEAGGRILEVEIASDPRPLLSIPLEVRPGGPPDPGSATLDLRGLLRVVTVTVLDDVSGAPLEDAWVYASDRAVEARIGRRFDGGTRVPGSGGVVLARPMDLAVWAPGKRVERVPQVFADCTVRLRAGLRVRLVLPAGLAPPEPPLFLHARIEPQEPAARLRRNPEAFEFDAEGRAAAWVHEPGKYLVRWMLERRAPQAKSVDRREPSVLVEVQDSAEEQVLELRFDPTELAAWMREL